MVSLCGRNRTIVGLKVKGRVKLMTFTGGRNRTIVGLKARSTLKTASMLTEKSQSHHSGIESTEEGSSSAVMKRVAIAP